MELQDLVSFSKKHRIKLVSGAVVGLVFGIITYYFLPTAYYATGSFYVNRSIETSDNTFFTYEGYYSQQTAQAYTNTLIAIFESTDVKSKALKDLGIDINEGTLRRANRNIKVKKAGPQLITVTVKSKAPNESKDTWLAVTRAATTTANEANSAGDPLLRVSMLGNEPVVKESFKNIYIYGFIGLVLGKVLALGIAAFMDMGKAGAKKK